MQPRNKDQEKEVLDWISEVTGEKLVGDYEDVLKNGIVLCKLINAIAPGSVKKIQEKGSNFQLMENIQRFQAGIKKYGVPEEEIFQTADLFEKRNIAQVTLCLYALARLVSCSLTFVIISYINWILIYFRPNCTPSTMDPVWDPRWLTRTSVSSPRSS